MYIYIILISTAYPENRTENYVIAKYVRNAITSVKVKFIDIPIHTYASCKKLFPNGSDDEQKL